MFGKKEDETLLLKELLRLGQRIEDFKNEIGKSIWHLEKKGGIYSE